MNWLIRMLGGVPMDEHVHDMLLYKRTVEQQLQQVIAKHDMQSAWEQLKIERKMGRVH